MYGCPHSRARVRAERPVRLPRAADPALTGHFAKPLPRVLGSAHERFEDGRNMPGSGGSVSLRYRLDQVVMVPVSGLFVFVFFAPHLSSEHVEHARVELEVKRIVGGLDNRAVKREVRVGAQIRVVRVPTGLTPVPQRTQLLDVCCRAVGCG